MSDVESASDEEKVSDEEMANINMLRQKKFTHQLIVDRQIAELGRARAELKSVELEEKLAVSNLYRKYKMEETDEVSPDGIIERKTNKGEE